MPEYDFAMDYAVLHEARNDLYHLAEHIAPTLNDSLFADLGAGSLREAEAVFGTWDVAFGFHLLYERASGPMLAAEDRLKQLGDLIGSLADGMFGIDAQIAEGMGVLGGQLGLDEWRSRKEAWDYRNEHVDQCVPDAEGKTPAFCSATDPGPPPTELKIDTGDGQVHVQLTLDDDNNVIRETTTVEHNGQKYTSTTTYSDGGKSYTTKTEFPDGGKETSVVRINDDGTGTMTVTDGKGEKTEYRRAGPGREWEKIS